MEPTQPPQPPQPVAPEPDRAQSQFIDRSSQQKMYPQVDDTRRGFSMPPDSGPEPPVSSGGLGIDIIVLITGLFSAVSYILLLSIFKTFVVTLTISGILALITIILSFKSYRANGGLSPFGVIGLSAATYAFIIIANVLAARATFQLFLGL